MNDCNKIYDSDDRLLFAGIRVRLGVYWAAQGTVVALLNKGTSTFNLRGPGMDTAVAISDSAHGGQSVLTQEVWDRVWHLQNFGGLILVHSQLRARSTCVLFKMPRDTSCELCLTGPTEQISCQGSSYQLHCERHEPQTHCTFG